MEFDYQSLAQYGIFCVLFVALFAYTIKNNETNIQRGEARESKYQETIRQLGEVIGVTALDSNKVAKAVALSVDGACSGLVQIGHDIVRVKEDVQDIKTTVGDIQLTLAKGGK